MRLSTQIFYDDEEMALQEVNRNTIKEQEMSIYLINNDKVETESDSYSLHHGFCTSIESVSPSVSSPIK
jgi:hypothetical protein